jgi:hypothetical protein
MSQVQTESDMLAEEAAGVYLGDIPARTLRQWRYLGRGPAYCKVEGHVRYRRADLDAYLAERRISPGPRDAA